MNELMTDELQKPDPVLKPFAHPYYQRLKGFLAVRAIHSRASFPSGTFAPGTVPHAYKFPSNLGTPKVSVKFGIVSLGGNIPQSDVTNYCKDSNTLMPNLRVMAIPGADSSSDPGGANVENNLDWQMILQAWNAAYPSDPCDITLMIAPNTANGIADCITALIQQGCQIINISWGAAMSQWSKAAITYTEAVLAQALAQGVIICVASGDNSLNDGTRSKTVDYPSASVNVWPVGGTNLKVNATGDYVSETAWGDGRPGDEGGGGGFAVGVPIPDFQKGVVPGSYLGVPSSSANADPNSGYQTYSDGAWGVVGGTSASSPMTAGLFGVILSMGGVLSGYQIKLYKAVKTCFNDVHLGSNGDPAGIGWDDSTGNGSPIGPGWVATLMPTVVVVPPPVNPPPVVPPPTSYTIPQAMPAGIYQKIG